MLDIWGKKEVEEKKVDKQFGGNEVKYCDFRHFLEIYIHFLAFLDLKNRKLDLKTYF